MEKKTGPKRTTLESKWVPELDHLLAVGIKHGPNGVHEAIEGILRLATGLTRGDCLKRIRYLRRRLEPPESRRAKRRAEERRRRLITRENKPRRPWTEQDDKDLQ